jgi:uncharacterized membrane protein
MELLTVLLLIAILILVIINGNRREEELRRLSERQRYLLEEFIDLRKQLKDGKAPASADKADTERPAQPRPAPRPEFQRPPLPVRPPVFEKPSTPVPQPIPAPAEPGKSSIEMPSSLAAKPAGTTEVNPYADESWIDRFFRLHPDLEKFIGENLVNKIGIAILVLGIAFFVKYAIDQNWIKENGRLAIAFASGGLLIGLAQYLRRAYKAFSSVLAGGGIAVFYFTIAFGYHQYGFFSQGTAFALLVVVTAFAVVLALLYDSLALAIIATLGGFATPFLVSNGSGNYVVLLSYLAELNTGILALSIFKRWQALQVLSLLCTAIIIGGWLFTAIGETGINYWLAFTLATINYFLFLGIQLAYPVRHRLPFRAFELTQILFLTGIYYAAGMLLLGEINGGQWQGLFTIASGAIDLVLAWYCFRHKDSDRNLLYLLIGLTLSFATLAVPVQLHGHAITLFWCGEFVLLYWLFQRSGIGLFRIGSWLIAGLAMGSLLMDWMLVPNTSSRLWLIFDGARGMVTNLVAVVAFVAYAFLIHRGRKRNIAEPISRPLLWVSGIMSLALFYLTAISAVNLYFYKASMGDVANVYHRLVTVTMALVVGAVLLRRRVLAAPVLQLAGALFALLLYLFSQGPINGLVFSVINGSISSIHFVVHLVDTALYFILFAQCIRVVRTNPGFAAHRSWLAWILSGAVVLFLSLDAGHLYSVSAPGTVQELLVRERQYNRAVLTILWGICSFALMWLGMRYRARTLRIISLTLFAATLLKLFFFDLHDVSEGGKIAAFILLGALLLTISFMYQKLKKLLIDDKPV